MLRTPIFLLVFTAAALAPAAPPAPVTVRVMSYNIHHGEGIDRKIDLERIGALITSARADVVGLQEVDRGVARTARRDLPAELARVTGMEVVFERNITYQGGEYGNAVLTRLPVRRSHNTHYRMLRSGEQRGLLQVAIDVHGREVLFLDTHLDFRSDDAERLLNVDEIKSVAVAASAPVILVGDFNSVPQSATIRKVSEFLTDAWSVAGHGDGFTIPAARPTKRIDYVFVSAAAIEPVSIEVLRSNASDHLPVIAELRIR